MIASESQFFARSLRTPVLAEVVPPSPMSSESSETIKTEESMNLTGNLSKSIRQGSNQSMIGHDARIINKGKNNSPIKEEPSQPPGHPPGHRLTFTQKAESPFTKAIGSAQTITVSKEVSDRKLPGSFIPGLGDKLREMEIESNKKIFNSLERFLGVEADPPGLEIVRRSL